MATIKKNQFSKFVCTRKLLAQCFKKKKQLETGSKRLKFKLLSY
jgi:hypothetical protein